MEWAQAARDADARARRDPASARGRRRARVTRPPAGRLVALFVGMALALGGVVVRLGVLQVRESGAYAALGIEQRLRTEQLPATRAKILDRTGSPLAVTLEARDVYANPSLVTDPVGRVGASSRRSSGSRARTCGQRSATPDTTFVYVARQRRHGRRRAHRGSRAAGDRAPAGREALLPGRARSPRRSWGSSTSTASGITGPRAAVRRGAGRHPRCPNGGAVGDGPGDRRRRAGPADPAARRRPRAHDRPADPVPGAAVPATRRSARTTRRAAPSS